MGAFIGTPGALIELMHWQESQSITQGAAPTVFTGLNGARTAFVQPRPGLVLREWDVSQDYSAPEEAAAFHALCLGMYGPGPFRFIDPLAQWNNVLTPRQSMLDPRTLVSTAKSSVTTVPGFGAVRSARAVGSGEMRFGQSTPVIPGRAVSARVWVRGAKTVRIQGLTATGGWTTSKSVDATLGWAEVSYTPDDSTALVDLRVTGGEGTEAALPLIAWVPKAPPWSVGRGAGAVVVSDFKESYERTGTMMNGSRAIGYSAKVTEVGSGA